MDPLFLEKIFQKKMLSYIPMLILGIVFIAIGIWFLSMVIPGVFSLGLGVYLTLRGNTKQIYAKALRLAFSKITARFKR